MRRRPYKSRQYRTPKLSHWQKGMLRHWAELDNVPTPRQVRTRIVDFHEWTARFIAVCKAARVDPLTASEFMRPIFDRREGIVAVTPGNRSRLSGLAQ